MTDSAADKTSLRKTALNLRNSTHASSTGAARRAAGHALREIGRLRHVRCVSAYMPMRSEMDTAPLLHALAGQGYAVCLPVVEAADAPLVFRSWAPGAALVPGAHGVMVPESGAEAEPEILVVPLVAFDADCYRLGYGGGYFDRTLARLRDDREIVALGFAYAAQEVVSLPRDNWDMPLDGIVTENGVRWRG